jgi:hypothetical protein
MIVDYDFTLGKKRLRGAGWRGLAALGLLFSVRAVVLSIIVFSAKPASAWFWQLLQHLLRL